MYQRDSVEPASDPLVLSIVGTNDIHGQFLPDGSRGGFTTFSGYVRALRNARANDGAVILVDGGDMWQGTLESNLNEGALMVEAFNAMGYAATTIGNHEFDFGPVGDKAVPEDAGDDPWGNLKLRATELEIPLLAANLIDETTNEIVDWENVQPSTMIEVEGIRIGIIGLLTRDTPAVTIAANFRGLRISPLSEAVVREATRLREAGAQFIIVTAHAGGQCFDYSDPRDLSACNLSSEILALADSLPSGLVNYINGGHESPAIAHIVNEIPITAAKSQTRSFSRVDFSLDRESGAVLDMRVFPPQYPCARVNPADGDCVWDDSETETAPAMYEGHRVVPNPVIAAIAERGAESAARLKLEELGVELDAPFLRFPPPESPLANLVMTALYESLDADVVLLNASGGLRSDLPAGNLTYGRVFELFPFDNRVVILDLSGAELRRIIAAQVHRQMRRTAISGMKVFVSCESDRLDLTMKLDTGPVINDDDRVKVAINDFLAMGGDKLVNPIAPFGGLVFETRPEMIRDVIADWLRRRGGTLHPSQFSEEGGRRWNLPDSLPAACSP